MIKENEVQKLQHDNLSIANVTLAVDEALQNANVDLYERKNIIDQQSNFKQNKKRKRNHNILNIYFIIALSVYSSC